MLLGMSSQMSTMDLLDVISTIYNELDKEREEECMDKCCEDKAKTTEKADVNTCASVHVKKIQNPNENTRHSVIDDICCYHINEDERTTEIRWKDGTHTKVKAAPEDAFDLEFGLMFCIMEHVCGNSKKYLTDIRKLVRRHQQSVALNKKLDEAVIAEEEKYKKKVARKIARKERKKREYDVNVMKQALLELKKEGLI